MNTMKLEYKIQGKKAIIEGTPTEIAKIIKKLKAEEDKQKQQAINQVIIPTQEEITKFIESKESFKHSMRDLISSFFDGKSNLEVGRQPYDYIYRMAQKARDMIEKKGNGKFKADKIPPADGKRVAIRTTTVWFLN